MKDSNLYKTLYRLDNAFGVYGDEGEVARIMRDEMEGLWNEHFSDPLGAQYFVKHGKDRSRKILFSAHMDEIGFIVNYIEEDGMLRFLPVATTMIET